jgi:glycosyltransferase involved in cell wall biosynthesis
VTDIGSFYRVLDGFVLSSVSEGLPMAILEAMAAGLPIIATRVGAIPEALGEGTAGVLVNPSDEIALAEELGSLIAALSAQRKSPSLGADDFAKWREIARAGRQRFEASYTAKAMASRYSVLYSPSLGLVRQ